jgi:hypothetical protein
MCHFYNASSSGGGHEVLGGGTFLVRRVASASDSVTATSV